MRNKQPFVSAESDCDLFGRLLVVSKNRRVDLKTLFEYELSTVHVAISLIWVGRFSKQTKLRH